MINSLPADILEKIFNYLSPEAQLSLALAAAEGQAPVSHALGFSGVEVTRLVARGVFSVDTDNLRNYRLIKSKNKDLWDKPVVEKIASDPFNLKNVLTQAMFLHGLHPDNTCHPPTPQELTHDTFHPDLLKIFSHVWTQSERKIFLDDRFARVSPALFCWHFNRDTFKDWISEIDIVIKTEDSHEILFRQACNALKALNRRNSNQIIAATITICHLAHLWNNDECKELWELLPGMLISDWGAEFYNGALIVTALANAGKVDQDIANKIKPILACKFKHPIIADAVGALLKHADSHEFEAFFVELEDNLLAEHTDEYTHAAIHLLTIFPEQMNPARCQRLFEELHSILSDSAFCNTDAKVKTLMLLAACHPTWQKEQLDSLFSVIMGYKGCGLSNLMDQASKTLPICFSDRYFEPEKTIDPPDFLFYLKIALDYNLNKENREYVRELILKVSPDRRAQVINCMRPFFVKSECAAFAIPLAIYLQPHDIATLAGHSPVEAKIIRFIKHHYENARSRVLASNTDTQPQNRLSII